MNEKPTVIEIEEKLPDVESALKLQRAYHSLCERLLNESDYAIIRGVKFRKRSGWAKLRRAFCVSVEVVKEERVELDDDWGFLFVARATLPTGRYAEAEGSCMASELEAGRIRPTVHNIRAKALTRAKNRVTSDILGAGTVSAEELTIEPAHWIDNEQIRKRFWTYALRTLELSREQVHEALGVKSIRDYDGTCDDAMRALVKYKKDKENENEPREGS